MRLEFNIPKKADVVIFDELISEDLGITLFPNRSRNHFDTRRRRINVPALLCALVKGGIRKVGLRYALSYISFVNPKICFIACENNLQFYQLKKYFPNVNFIVAQQWVTFFDSFLKNFYLINSNDKLSCDYFLSLSSRDKNFFSNVISSKFIISGSLRNNNLLFPHLAKIRRGGVIGFVSQWRDFKNKEYFDSQIKLLKYIKNYCDLYHLDLKIALASNRIDKKLDREKEIRFYNQFFKKFEISIHDSHIHLRDCSMIICGNSNLGLELISNGMRVFFVNVTHATGNQDITYFSSLYGRNGPFWCDLDLLEENFCKMESIRTASNEEWNERILKYEMPITVLDPDNLKLKKIIDKL